MRGEEKRSVISFQVVLKPALGLQVKIVCRFIQEQYIGIEEKESGQFDTCLPASAELRQETAEIRFGEAQA